MAEEMTPKIDDALDTGNNTKSENLPVQVTSIQLNKDNYLSWTVALEIGITSRGRLSYITGEKPAPSKTDPRWATQMYGRKKRVLRTYQIKRSIYSLKQGDLSVASFFAALKTKWEELDYHVNDDWHCGSDHASYWDKEWMDRTFIFLGGLRDKFESIRSQILNCDEIPGVEEVYARVESEEQRRQVMHIDSSQGSSPSAFVSRASGTGQRPARRCSHCNKLGHSVDFCWDLHPEKQLVRGRPPSSRRSPSAPEPSQSSLSNVAKSKLSSDQLKELQAYISRLSTTQEDASTSEGAKLAQALVATSDQGEMKRVGKHLCMAAKVPAAVRLAKQALLEDKCVVIGLQSTGEARTEEAVTKYGLEMDDFVSGPRELLLKLVEENYPLPQKPNAFPGEEGARDVQRKRHSASSGISFKGRVRKVAKWQHASDSDADGDSEHESTESDEEFQICEICMTEEDQM
ncbi:strawberry notch-like protein 1 [Nymphaea thermarum]|nr:strawberry notch-like protein 1 [Nymphaea thermarum]